MEIVQDLGVVHWQSCGDGFDRQDNGVRDRDVGAEAEREGFGWAVIALSVAVGLFHLPGQRRFVGAVCMTVIKRTRSFAESKCSVRGTESASAGFSVTPLVDARAQRSLLGIATGTPHRAFTLSRRGPADNTIRANDFDRIPLLYRHGRACPGGPPQTVVRGWQAQGRS